MKDKIRYRLDVYINKFISGWYIISQKHPFSIIKKKDHAKKKHWQFFPSYIDQQY